MDIRLTTGEPIHRFDDQVGYVLCQLGLATRIADEKAKPAAPPAPRWSVGYGNGEAVDPRYALPHIQLVTGAADVHVFSGASKAAKHYFQTIGFDLPDDILIQYVRVVTETIRWTEDAMKRTLQERSAGQHIGNNLTRLQVALEAVKKQR